MKQVKGFKCEIYVVTRSPDAIPNLLQTLGISTQNVNVIQSDLGSGQYPSRSENKYFDLIFHGATPASTLSKSMKYDELENATVGGLKEIIHSSVRSDGRTVVVNLSSGAVYGNEARRARLISETCPIASHPEVESGYCRVKILSEDLVSVYSNKGLIRGTNPRLFAFAGPGIPLNEKFAVGSFVNSAISGKTIEVYGSPYTTRSYMYPSDLVTSLFRLAVKPTLDTIHLGSNKPLNMQAIAEKIDSVFNGKGIKVSSELTEVEHYVPETTNTENQLNFKPLVDFENSLLKWRDWINDSKQSVIP